MKFANLISEIPKIRGTYCIIFKLEDNIQREIRKFGSFSFSPGFYFYFGSAKGSGGLSARMMRHIIGGKKAHWHLDYLRPDLIFYRAYFTNQINLECEWYQTVLHQNGFEVPIIGFGATDCSSSCSAHLLSSKELMDSAKFTNILGAVIDENNKLYLYDQAKC